MALNWKNLKTNRCPECNKDLTILHIKAFCTCGFSINKEKMEHLKYKMLNNISVNGRRNFEEDYG